MDRRTILALNALNRRFYATRAEEFRASRHAPWPGWERMVDPVDPTAPIRVLDVGCGNGRLIRFLSERWRVPFSYLGIDASRELLSRCRKEFAGTGGARFRETDAVASLVESKAVADIDDGAPYSLIAVLGFLHHVPGRETRQNLLVDLCRRLGAKGTLAVSIWRFGAFDRFDAKIVPWPEALKHEPELAAIGEHDLEAGDHLVAWGRDRKPVRYCHFVDDAEVDALVGAVPLPCIDRYDADGALNRYLVFRGREVAR